MGRMVLLLDGDGYSILILELISLTQIDMSTIYEQPPAYILELIGGKLRLC